MEQPLPLPAYLQDLADLGIHIHDFLKPTFKYTSLTSAQKIIENNTVRFRTPASFNDPLEFSKNFFDFYCSRTIYKQKIIRGFETKLNRKLNKSEIKQLLTKHKIEDFIKAYQIVVENARQKSLLFCTSKKHNNSLMWSHYAQSHTGVVLGIYIPPVGKISNNAYVMSLCVNYAEEIIKQPAFTINDDKSKSIYYWIYTKSIDWKYEDEVRTFIDNSSNEFQLLEESLSPYTIGKYCDIKLDNRQLCEIYYGVNTPQAEIDKLESIIDNSGLNINSYKMQIVKDTFNIIEHLIKQRRDELIDKSPTRIIKAS